MTSKNDWQNIRSKRQVREREPDKWGAFTRESFTNADTAVLKSTRSKI